MVSAGLAPVPCNVDDGESSGATDEAGMCRYQRRIVEAGRGARGPGPPGPLGASAPTSGRAASLVSESAASL